MSSVASVLRRGSEISSIRLATAPAVESLIAADGTDGFVSTRRGAPMFLMWSRSSQTGSVVVHGLWRSLVARLLWEQEVVGSSPTNPTVLILAD